jgi:nitroreductase
MSMDALSAIELRRSIKHYDPTHVMPEADVEKLMQLAMYSPTSFNIQHWRFVLVRDTALRQQIRAAAWNQAQVTDASLLIVICGNQAAWAENPGRYWVNAPQPVQDFLVPAIGKFYSVNEQAQRDEVMRSCGIAAQTIMIAAKAMGYDTCPMVGFDPEAVAKIINLPKDHIIAMMITVGKGIKDPWPRPGQLPMSEVVIRDRFA